MNQERLRTDVTFCEASAAISAAKASEIVSSALKQWHAPDYAQAVRREAILASEFPDDHSHDTYWNSAATRRFREFFTWGHDHDFGCGVFRRGAMGPRHIEILTECLTYGLLQTDWSGLHVLDVGCWSGGDALVFAGGGARVQAIEEHQRSAASAQRLFELVGAEIPIHTTSVYADRVDWQHMFDIIYASGVIYHVTDPLLFTRLLFAYLKPGGRLILETKGVPDKGSFCSYSGTMEKGWNWYGPSREVLGRWLVDAGFDPRDIQLHVRENGRLLASAVKRSVASLPETAGFSRPGSWLEGTV